MNGAWGENAARLYLERKGYRTRETNFRTRFGEIDIIAEHGEYIVFVEVKTRKNDRFAPARAFVTPAKQQRITATAALWLQQHPTGKQPRFDVVEVYGEQGAAQAPRICHLENAFGG